jgi:hypothetical protein
VFTMATLQQMGGPLVLRNDGHGTSAVIALLEEAVEGRAAILGVDHPDTKYSREVLDWAKSKDAQSEDCGGSAGEERQQEEEEEEEEEEEKGGNETIADRIRKRRRRA